MTNEEEKEMEFTLQAVNGAIPCEVTVDEENGRYMLRKEDTSGEIFNSPEELLQWVEVNWSSEKFQQPEEFQHMILSLRKYVHEDA